MVQAYFCDSLYRITILCDAILRQSTAKDKIKHQNTNDNERRTTFDVKRQRDAQIVGNVERKIEDLKRREEKRKKEERISLKLASFKVFRSTTLLFVFRSEFLCYEQSNVLLLRRIIKYSTLIANKTWRNIGQLFFKRLVEFHEFKQIEEPNGILNADRTTRTSFYDFKESIRITCAVSRIPSDCVPLREQQFSIFNDLSRTLQNS